MRESSREDARKICAVCRPPDQLFWLFIIFPFSVHILSLYSSYGEKSLSLSFRLVDDDDDDEFSSGYDDEDEDDDEPGEQHE